MFSLPTNDLMLTMLSKEECVGVNLQKQSEASEYLVKD